MSHVNETCLITKQGDPSADLQLCALINESSNLSWMSQVSCNRVMSHFKTRWHAGGFSVLWSYERVMSHMNESCLTWLIHVSHEWFVSRINKARLVSKQGDTSADFESFHRFLVALVISLCCSMLQCVAVCCSVLQCVSVCCSMSQCVVVRCSVLQCVAVFHSVLQYVAL